MLFYDFFIFYLWILSYMFFYHLRFLFIFCFIFCFHLFFIFLQSFLFYIIEFFYTFFWFLCFLYAFFLFYVFIFFYIPAILFLWFFLFISKNQSGRWTYRSNWDFVSNEGIFLREAFLFRMKPSLFCWPITAIEASVTSFTQRSTVWVWSGNSSAWKTALVLIFYSISSGDMFRVSGGSLINVSCQSIILV